MASSARYASTQSVEREPRERDLFKSPARKCTITGANPEYLRFFNALAGRPLENVGPALEAVERENAPCMSVMRELLGRKIEGENPAQCALR
jgi:hypothetical protein